MWWRIHHSLVTAVGVAVGALLLLIVVGIPMYNHTSELTTKWRAKQNEREEVLNKVSTLTQLDPTVLAERVSTIDAALPPKKDILTYLAAIDGLSSELGVSFGGVDLAPGILAEATSSGSKKNAPVKGGVESLTSEVKIVGDREKVYAFLRAIEQVLPLMQIDNVKVSVSNDGQYSLALTLGMLWAQQGTEALTGKIVLFDETEEKYFQQLSGYRQYAAIVSTASTGEIAKSDLFVPFTPQQ